MKKTVMILNGETSAGLALVRSFGKRGIDTIVGGDRYLSRAFYSKYCKKFFVYPNSHRGPREIHKVLLENIRKFRPQVLIPVGTDTTSTVAKYQEEYSEYTKVVPLLDKEKYSKLADKKVQIELAKKYKIPIPQTWCPRDIEELKRLKKRLPYPVLIKPRLSRVHQGMLFVESERELVPKYKEVINRKPRDSFTDYTQPIIQEYIPVDKNKRFLYHYNESYKPVYLLLRNNRVVASFQVTSSPPENPVPDIYHTYKNFTPAKDDKLKNLAIKFLKKIGWEGVANVQFIVDPRNTQARFIEVNPRIWGGIESPIRHGIDFPYLWYKLALNEPINENLDYPCNNTKFRWILFGEVYSFFKSKNKRKFLKELFDGNTYYEVSLKDFKPHIAHFFCYLLYKMGI